MQERVRHACGAREQATLDNYESASLLSLVTSFPRLLFTYVWSSVLFYKDSPSRLRTELLSGIVVAVMQIPESIAFSNIIGVAPLTGIFSSAVVGMVTSVFGGKRGMISGLAGAFAVIQKDVMSPTGPLGGRTPADRFEHLLMVMALCGVIQLVVGMLRLGLFATLIPHTAMIGFMNGLAIIIFIAQLSAFQRCPLHDKFLDCTEKNREWLGLGSGQVWALLALVALSMFIMHFWRKLPRVGRIVPPPLVAIVAGTLIEHFLYRTLFGVETRTVAETASSEGDIPAFHIPNVGSNGDWGVILTNAGSLAAVGIIESVMTLAAIDEMTETPRSDFRTVQECFAQGLANLVCGLTGLLGGDTMIGQSTVNIMNGASGRLSAFIGAAAILAVGFGASVVIGLIPIGVLTGVLFMVVIHTFHWGTFRLLLRVSRLDSFVIVMVTVLAVVTNLAIAVLAGVAVNALGVAWYSKRLLLITTDCDNSTENSSTDATIVTRKDAKKKTYVVRGTLFFSTLHVFEDAFDVRHDPALVEIDFSEAVIADLSTLEAIRRLGVRYRALDKKLVVVRLPARAHRRANRHTGLDNTVRLPGRRAGRSTFSLRWRRTDLPAVSVTDEATDESSESSDSSSESDDVTTAQDYDHDHEAITVTDSVATPNAVTRTTSLSMLGMFSVPPASLDPDVALAAFMDECNSVG